MLQWAGFARRVWWQKGLQQAAAGSQLGQLGGVEWRRARQHGGHRPAQQPDAGMEVVVAGPGVEPGTWAHFVGVEGVWWWRPKERSQASIGVQLQVSGPNSDG